MKLSQVNDSKIIVGPAGSGKTKKLIMLSHEKQIPIICPSYHECCRIVIMARNMDVTIPAPISIHNILNGNCNGIGPQHYIIDDVDRILNNIVKGNIVAMSMTTNK